MSYNDHKIRSLLFTEANPDKGTKTQAHVPYNTVLNHMFTEANPDKGTKTMREKLRQRLEEKI